MLRGRDFGLYSSSVRRSKIPHADETMRARPRAPSGKPCPTEVR